MGSNQFGTLFRITTWGESHGPAIGVVIDGCPANLPISREEIQSELSKRRPGHSPFTSPRKESDEVQILSGIYQDLTTGAPISLIIYNRDADSQSYKAPIFRPGHADYTYKEKYGHFDPRGGGRASARETALRVAAGAIAKKLLKAHQIELIAYIKEIGGIAANTQHSFPQLQTQLHESALFCPDPEAEKEMSRVLTLIKEAGDSLGGVVECVAHLPVGLGDPVYEKLQANLAKALLTIPATKGFEIGSGFEAARMKGSEHNDPFEKQGSKIGMSSNHAGGVLGGISNGMPLLFRVAFKPTSSIKRTQKSVTYEGKPTEFSIPETGRHDPCVAIRAVPVVEAMAALVIADSLLMQRAATLSL